MSNNNWSRAKRYIGQVWGNRRRSKLAIIEATFTVVVLVVLCAYVYQNQHALGALHVGQKLDKSGQYTRATKVLTSINETLVSSSTRKQIKAELEKSQQLASDQSKLNEVKKLLSEHKTAQAEKLLKQVQANLPPGVGSGGRNQVAALTSILSKQTSSSLSMSHQSGGNSSGGSSAGGSSGSGSGGGSGGSSGGGSPGPLTSVGVVSFNASSSPASAYSCNISGTLTFSANGSGTVSTTWELLSTKSTSEIDNPTNFNFSSAGNQNDSFNFGGTQGLESGDSYRVAVVISSTTNASITTTAGPIVISNCASPPGLVAEQESPNMTAITPGTPSIYEYQDPIFPNECSVQVTTPYSVNSSGTVEAIVRLTSASSIGYTYYDKNGASAFTGPGSTNDTSYFRLPHLPGGGQYSLSVKLVEVSDPGTVLSISPTINSACD